MFVSEALRRDTGFAERVQRRIRRGRRAGIDESRERDFQSAKFLLDKDSVGLTSAQV